LSSEYFILNCHLNDLKNSLKRKCKIIGARTKVSRAAARFLAASGDLDPGVSSPAPAPSDPGRCNLSSLKTVLIFRSHPKAGAHVLAIPTSSLVLRTTNLRVRIIKKKTSSISHPAITSRTWKYRCQSAVSVLRRREETKAVHMGN